ncbi:MAG: hypothetical protein ACJ8CR_09695 [Roseiflexaceae bacterium]
MLVVLGQITLIVACALALCIYAGWGAAALGLPVRLHPFAALLAPLAGYALAIWLGYIGVSSALDLRWSLALLLALATALNILAWRRGARPRPHVVLRTEWPLLALLLATLLVGVLPLLHYGYLTAIGQGWDTESYLPMAPHLIDYPLARIAEAPPSPLRDLVRNPPQIGVTLGFSVFQGMTMLLSRQSALATFAPLLALLRALGVLAVYVWLRATMGLGRWPALLGAAGASAGALLLWVSYFNFGMQLAAWPLLAFGLTLGIAAVEELARRPTTDDRRPTTDDRRPTTDHGSSMATKELPDRFSVLGSWFSVLGSRFSVLVLAGVALAALPVAYYPALTIWAPMALALGAARLSESLGGARNTGAPGPARLLLASLVLGVVTLALAAPTIQDYYEGFSFRYSLPAQHVGPDRFIAPAETIGLAAFRLPDDGPQPPAALTLGALALVVLLCLAGLALPADDRPRTTDHGPPTTDTGGHGGTGLSVLGSRFLVLGRVPSGRFSVGYPLGGSPMFRLRWLAVLAAVLAYLAWLRFGRPYEYAYMKGSAYAGFVAWGLVALGAQALGRRLGTRLRPLAAALALAPLLVAAWAQALTIADHWRGPAIFTRDIAAFDSAAAQVPPGATIAVTSDAAFTGPISGQLIASLYGRAIWGHLSTAYTSFDDWPAGRMPQYALLAATERPWPLDYGGRELWRSGTAALYRLDDTTRVLHGRSEFYSSTPATDRGSPAALAIWRRGGANRVASHAQPLTIAVGDMLHFGRGPAQGAPRKQQLRLTVASLVAQTVALSDGDRTMELSIAPGVSRIDLRLATPAELTIAPDDGLALIDAIIRDPDGAAAPAAQLAGDQVAWSASAEQRGPTTSLRVDFANPGRRALRVDVAIVEDTFEAPQQPLRLLAAAPLDGAWQIQIDLARGATQALVGETPTPLLAVEAKPGPPDGAYFGVLTLYDGEEPVAHTPVFMLHMQGGQVASFAPVPFTVEATPLGTPATLPANQRALLPEARALDDGAATLEGALLQRPPPWPGAGSTAPLRPGDPLTIRLGWRGGPAAPPPLMVSLQMLGADDHKWAQWDGPAGGDWRPIQSWSAGERVRQDVPLTLDPATPPGNYRLLLVVYDPATGQPRPLGGQSALLLGELVVQ